MMFIMIFTGDFPPIEAIAASIDDPTPSVNVALDTRGSPDVDFVALTLDGAVSLPFSVGSLDAAGVWKIFYLVPCTCISG